MSRSKAKRGEKQKEPRPRPARRRMHPAGPHARPELTDPEATPGTGALPDISVEKDVDPGSE